MIRAYATLITGALAKTSKMPCYSWDIPAKNCKAGGLYSTYENAICNKKNCYAKKGRSNFPKTQNAQTRRLEAWRSNQPLVWTEGMIWLLNHQKKNYFRWFGAGDIQGEAMLEAIYKVCRATPHIHHWLPTLERGIVLKVNSKTTQPDNLCIRFSSPFIDKPSTSKYPISWVTTDPKQVTCQATLTRSTCENCRDCWDPSVTTIVYNKH